MTESDEKRIHEAAVNTEVLRLPKQTLATFGTTSIHYYLITEPSYPEVIESKTSETVIREGRVIAQKPKIVTPYYLSQLEGFSGTATRYFKMLVREVGANAAGIFYTYKNDATELSIVSEHWKSVAARLIDDIERRGDSLASVIKGQDDLWDVSIMKFIFEVTRNSLQDNVSQMGARGLLNVDASGLPREAGLRIEELFWQVSRGEREPDDLKSELDRWGVFGEYEDRFLRLFQKRRKH